MYYRVVQSTGTDRNVVDNWPAWFAPATKWLSQLCTGTASFFPTLLGQLRLHHWSSVFRSLWPAPQMASQSYWAFQSYPLALGKLLPVLSSSICSSGMLCLPSSVCVSTLLRWTLVHIQERVSSWSVKLNAIFCGWHAGITCWKCCFRTYLQCAWVYRLARKSCCSRTSVLSGRT